MGGAPSQPTLNNLPKPDEGSDLHMLLLKEGFVFGEPLGERGITVRVTSKPDGWCLRNTSTSTYSDYVNMELISSTGLVIAEISGKFTSYDSYCRIQDVSTEGKVLDMSTGSIDSDGFFQDQRSLYQQQVKYYKALCRSCKGYESTRQEECNQAYAKLEETAKQHGFEFNVQQILLGNNPIAGAAEAMTSLATGTD